MAAPHGTPETLFWAKVHKTDACWMWTGAVNGHGYGHCGRHGHTHSAHRLAWELAYGAIPEGMSVLHRCDVPLCVRPEHLFLGTQADNIHDMHAKGRFVSVHAQKTHCKQGHPFSGDNLVRAKTQRRCRICMAASQARSRNGRKS